ncbi:retropepsin-like aspartic protease family protein [Sphingomonas arenae]|uniref:retropepsin-like aspartic protease family protein n=1 Tax=Sphingomonas arenae TaxID=2812555 RepID=UPI0019678812|nr:TIGR02281 family clan AA aspartic protease [Sphingomonas arenae]
MQKLLAGLAVVLLAVGAFVWSGGAARPSAPTKEIILERSSDGHFYADVAVNGHTIRFLIDTGAGAVALTEEDAREAGITVDSTQFRSIGEGPSGMVLGTFVTPDSVALQGFAPADIKAAVVQGASVSLLGQPFLDRLDEIVIRKDVMILRYS